MDPEKAQAISEFPEPRNRKDLQSFIGFCNFYRKFSQNHSTLLLPLAGLLKKGAPWEFGQSERTTFQEIKNVFSQQVSLTHPDFNKTFSIQTNASILGLGAEFFQVDHNNIRHTISFAGRNLIAADLGVRTIRHCWLARNSGNIY